VKGEHVRSEEGREGRAGGRAGEGIGCEGRTSEVRIRKGRERRAGGRDRKGRGLRRRFRNKF
jgi:hypothetical protein